MMPTTLRLAVGANRQSFIWPELAVDDGPRGCVMSSQRGGDLPGRIRDGAVADGASGISTGSSVYSLTKRISCPWPPGQGGRVPVRRAGWWTARRHAACPVPRRWRSFLVARTISTRPSCPKPDNPPRRRPRPRTTEYLVKVDRLARWIFPPWHFPGASRWPMQAQCLGMTNFTELPSIPSAHLVPFTDSRCGLRSLPTWLGSKDSPDNTPSPTCVAT